LLWPLVGILILARVSPASGTAAPGQGGASESPAADVDPEARRLFKEGHEHFRRGEYDEAIQRFKAAHLRHPAAALLYDIAQAHRLKGDCAQAVELYRQYLATGPVDVMRARTEARIRELDPCAPPAVKSGSSVAGHAASVAEVVAAPPPPRAPPPAAPPVVGAGPAPRFAGGRKVGVALGAVSIAAAAIAALAGRDSVAAAGEVSSMFSPGAQWNDAGMSAERDGLSSETMALTSAAVALTTGAVSVWLLLRGAGER
jgi:hypothetical protein